MKIAIAGASGFLGSSLTNDFESQGYQVVKLTRGVFTDPNIRSLTTRLEGCDVVINLAGKPLLGRWTKRHKEEVYNSRVELTCKLVEAINTLDTPPKLFISASAIGYYPSNKIYSEHNNRMGNDYISWLCREWETAASQVIPQVRLAIIRISPVLSRNGGILSPLFRVLAYKVGIKVGTSGSCFSWIHISDFIAAINFIIVNNSISGVVNLSAPGITTNDYLSAILSDAMNAPVTIRVPNPVLTMAFGDSRHLVSNSKAIYPAVLLEKGFKFRYPYIKAAIDNIVEN